MKVTTFRAVSRLQKFALLGLIAAVFMVMSAPAFAGTTVTVVGGNPTHLSEYRIEDPETKVYVHDGITISVSVYSTDMGQMFDFTSSAPVTRAVAKGGTGGATVYDYDPPVMGGTGLHAPVNPSGKYADLSWIGFSFGEVGDPEDPDPEDPDPEDPDPETPEPEDPEPETPEAETPEEPVIQEEPALPFTEEEEEPFLPFTGGPEVLLLGAAAVAGAGTVLRRLGR